MRYYWGLAVGHTYTHGGHTNESFDGADSEPEASAALEREGPDPPRSAFDEIDAEDTEFSLRSRDDDDLDDSESSDVCDQESEDSGDGSSNGMCEDL
jgi:hypothetical protein